MTTDQPTSAVGNIAAVLRTYHPEPDRFFVSTRPAGQKKGWQDRPVDSAAQAAALMANLAASHDVYFTMAAYQPGATRRLAVDVMTCRGLWIDLDPDPYGALDATLRAAIQFGRALGAPPSLIIVSGGGCHLHWITAEPMLVELWADLSGRLLGAAEQHGLKIKDPGCTTDAARVLRPPWTLNHKYSPPRDTFLADAGDAYDVTSLRTVLQNYQTPEGAWARAAGKVDADKIKFRRVGGLDPRSFCPQVAKSLSEGGAHDGYWLWAAMLQVATKVEDAAEWSAYVRRVSEKHPGYAGDAHAEWKASTFDAPPTCARLDRLRPGICPSCPSWGKVKSPVALWQWERVFALGEKRRIDAEMDRLREVYWANDRQGGPTAALAAVERNVTTLVNRDAALARTLAFNVLSWLAGLGWSCAVLTDAGAAMGLERVEALRWATRIMSQENAPLPVKSEA